MSIAHLTRVGAPVPRVAWLQLAATIVLFGFTWPVMKIGLMAGTPIWLAAGRAALSALTAFLLLAALGRLKWPPREEWPIILSVGALQLTSFFALANLGVQSLPAGRSVVLAYSTMLWMVPLSLLVGEKVGGRALAGVALGLAGLVVLVDPTRFDWHDRNVVMGHVYLLLAGFTWALAMMHMAFHA
jgi:drug/metabolite transporter (DMT)-like permease